MKRKSWLPILFAFVLPILAVYAWWGGFSRVDILEAERGPYVYAYLEHRGDIARIPKTEQLARAALQAQQIAAGMAITVLLDDPRRVPRDALRAQVGFLIDPAVAVAAPLQRGEIPVRRVLVAQVRAAALLAPSKAYQALHEHLAAQGRTIRMPTVELYDSPPQIYRMGMFHVEMAQ